jgi:hypothetical protein
MSFAILWCWFLLWLQSSTWQAKIVNTMGGVTSYFIGHVLLEKQSFYYLPREICNSVIYKFRSKILKNSNI